MSREIPLTQGQVAQVDESDFLYLSQWKWHAMWSGDMHSYYGVRTVNKLKVTTILMHRVILNAQPGQLVDHINHQTLDNRRSNIRLCLPSGNTFHRRKSKNNTSGFIGVYWDGDRRRWISRIRVNGKIIRLGRFTDKREAAWERDCVAKQVHGEFAVLNFPEVANG
jgi:hypothetical protein